jgi:Protein of unknown function (DUF3047)
VLRGKILILTAPALLAAGCATTSVESPDDSLVWSAALAHSLPRETAATIEAAQFSKASPGAPLDPWEPYLLVRANAPTDYRLVRSEDGVVLEAYAPQGGSGLYRKIRINTQRHSIIEWRWKVARLPDSDPASASRASPMVRLSLGFHGDMKKLDFDDRAKLRLAKLLTANGLPYASLMYVWMRDVPVDTVIRYPHTDRVRMIVVESGEEHLGQWVSVRRNVLEDYRRAFAEEPQDLVGVGVMTDVGDDGSPRRTFYGDITFRSTP